MENSKDELSEKKIHMWKMREELLNSMSDKELRAFIKGYMMAQKMVFKQLNAMSGCDCGNYQGGSSCRSEGCGCGSNECNCGKG